MGLAVRAATVEEQATLKRLAQARTEPARRVERARIIWLALQGERVPAIATAIGCGERTVRRWLKRFAAHGLAGLQDAPRAGRPPTYTADQVGVVIATALTNPATLDLPFACWTLDRLAAYLNEVQDIPIKRSRIDEILINEGLRWRAQETWFGERVDPAFAQKRGRSRRSTATRLTVVS